MGIGLSDFFVSTVTSKGQKEKEKEIVAKQRGQASSTRIWSISNPQQGPRTESNELHYCFC